MGPRSQHLIVPLMPICLVPEFYFYKIHALVIRRKSNSWISQIWDTKGFKKNLKLSMYIKIIQKFTNNLKASNLGH